VLAVLFFLTACQVHNAPPMPKRTIPAFPAEWRYAAGRQATFAEHAMVTSDSRLASDVGIEILRRGGNAIDAAVAMGYALAVTFPLAGNIGGGGFMVVRRQDGQAAALDFREVAPLGAARDMYLDASGKKTDAMIVGHLAVAVPGSVAGLAEAHQRFGRLPLADVMAPAIRLADDGFAVDSMLSLTLRFLAPTVTRFAGRDVFYRDGNPLAPGDMLVQRDLARTLRQIAAEGPAAFYRGAIADLLVDEMRREGGIITKEDLERYRPIWRDPLIGTYRGYSVITMPLSSSGGTALIEALNILETVGPLPPFERARYKHLVTESFRGTFADRNTRLCDPAFCDPPVAQLTSKEYARQQSRTIDFTRASRSPPVPHGPAGMHTTHYSVVDADGNAVAVTTTINTGFGSGVLVTGAGFFLNNEMDDFATAPGQPNFGGLIQGEQNRIEPGKRPLSSMSPTIVLDASGNVLLVTGGAGGPTIITGVLQVILNVVEHLMTLGDAMHAPRIHHQTWPDSIQYEQGGITAAVLDSLRAMGHGLVPVPGINNISAIMRVAGGWHGKVQPAPPGFPRASAAAVGY
jgi:gamma-glutamyltranspeptidase/glutathione hydrolase